MYFYEIFVQECQKRGVKPGRAAESCGINRSNVTNWKNGGYTPRGDALQRIADYFGVTVDYLLGNEKAPTPKGERTVSDDDMKFALWGDVSDIDDGDLEDVKRYAAYIREKKKK